MIKLINYLPHGVIKEEYISKSSIDNMCRESEFIGDGFTNVCMNGGYHLHVKETPEEILAMPDIEEGGKTINWEQRRYEIAKEMLPVIYYDDKPQEGEDYLTLNQAANEAVRYAEALITELKKGTEQ